MESPLTRYHPHEVRVLRRRSSPARRMQGCSMKHIVLAAIVAITLGFVTAGPAAADHDAFHSESDIGAVIFAGRLADTFETQYHTVYGNIMTNMHGNADAILGR